MEAHPLARQRIAARQIVNGVNEYRSQREDLGKQRLLDGGRFRLWPVESAEQDFADPLAPRQTAPRRCSFAPRSRGHPPILPGQQVTRR